MKNSFEQLGINENLVKGLAKEGINNPTKIQEKAIPEALSNKDIVAESETGSGKTLAYILPLFQKIQTEKREMQALILTPTHELAIQVNTQIKNLSNNSEVPVTSAAIIGNVNIKKQVEILKNEKPHIIVGSQGRILELIKMKKIKAHTIKTIVVDEADRLLDKDNVNNIKAIISTTLKERQLLFFSATISVKTENVAKDLMKNYSIIKIKDKSVLNENIKHMCFVCEQRDKIVTLRKLMHILKPKRAIAFINKTYEIELAVEKLKYQGIKVEAIYGNAEKDERKKAINNFRLGKSNLLVASDIAARGLDIKGVDYIFSLDIPEETEKYLHRAGRTGRAGEKGTSICIITDKEKFLLSKYEKDLNIKIHVKDMYGGKIVEVKRK